MSQKPTSKHYSSPAARSVAEASVSSSSSDELFSDVSCCVFPSARQHVVVELGELALLLWLEAQVLRGALEVFLVISGGILSASFGRVPSPGPGKKIGTRSPRPSPDVIAYDGSDAASSLPLFLLQEKNQLL